MVIALLRNHSGTYYLAKIIGYLTNPSHFISLIHSRSRIAIPSRIIELTLDIFRDVDGV